MIEIFFSPANIIVTTLFIVIVLYWLIVLFGAIDMETIDIDFDVDVDTDVDLEVDTDAGSSNIFGLNKILHFFNLGKIPFMVFLTFLIVPWWFATVIINNFLGFESFIPGLLVAAPTLIGALLLSKVLTTPFVKLFAVLDKDDEHADVIGTIGEVLLPASNSKTGQGEFKIDNSFLRINIRTRKGITVQPGDHVMLVDHKITEDFYLVEPHIKLD